MVRAQGGDMSGAALLMPGCEYQFPVLYGNLRLSLEADHSRAMVN